MKQILLALFCCMTTFAAVGQGVGDNDLPDIGSSGDAVWSQSEEYRIGLSVVRQLREQGQILEDPEVTEYIQSVGSRIAAQATEGGQRFTFFVVKDGGINAFALPGGFIGVNYGLILATENESQLASVLAHEIAHVTQRHIARSVRAQGRQSLATTAMVVAGILLGAMAGGDAAQAAIAIAQGSAIQQQINYTRSNEYEADRVGISFLASAGFDPFEMPEFFEIMGRRNTVVGQQVPEFLMTHPVTTNRIAESRNRATSYPRKNVSSSLGYELIRERVRVVGGASDDDLRPYYEARGGQRRASLGEQYGAAIAELRTGHASDATATLGKLYADHDGNPMLAASLGEAQMAAGDADAAFATFRSALRVSPRNVPLTVRYAQALLKADRAREAHMVLLDLFNNVMPTPEQIRLTAMAASAAGDTGDAYYYMSEYHIASGNLPLSIQQLELALAAPNLTGVQRQRFQARLDEIRDATSKERRKQRQREDAGKAERSGMATR